MLKITEQYIPKGNKNRPAHPMSPKYITIHDTGNASKGAGAKNHAIYAGRGVNEVGYHFVCLLYTSQTVLQRVRGLSRR